MRTSPWVALLALLVVPMAAAHGAPEPREIDLRILADGTASGDYGGPQGIASDGAPDLLVLDVREAYDTNGQAMVVFRFIHQLGDPESGSLGIDVTFTAGGKDHAYSMTTLDGLQYTSDSYARIDGPFDVGDGTPKAVEGWIPISDIGTKIGDEISEIRVTSALDGAIADRMPGTYDVQGITVPAIPPEDAIPGTFTIAGPANLLDIEVSVNTLEIGEADTANITLSNPLGTFEQFVSLAASAPEGVVATLDADGILLATGETRTVTLSISGDGRGEVAILVQSDLGAYKNVILPLIGTPMTADDSDVLSGDLDNGGSFQHTFTTVGVFDYHCHPHPWMTATITIEEDDNATAPQTHTVRIIEPDAADSKSWAFDPAELTIQAGDTVVWVNEGNQVHVIMGGVAGEGHHANGGGHGPPGHHGEDNEEPDDAGIPSIPAVALVAALAVAALLRRRN